MTTQRDEELMLAYQQGDVSAMEELVARYKLPVFRFAFRLCRTAAEAEETYGPSPDAGEEYEADYGTA